MFPCAALIEIYFWKKKDEPQSYPWRVHSTHPTEYRDTCNDRNVRGKACETNMKMCKAYSHEMTSTENRCSKCDCNNVHCMIHANLAYDNVIDFPL